MLPSCFLPGRAKDLSASLYIHSVSLPPNSKLSQRKFQFFRSISKCQTARRKRKPLTLCDCFSHLSIWFSDCPRILRSGRGVNRPPYLAPTLQKEWSYICTSPTPGLHGWTSFSAFSDFRVKIYSKSSNDWPLKGKNIYYSFGSLDVKFLTKFPWVDCGMPLHNSLSSDDSSLFFKHRAKVMATQAVPVSFNMCTRPDSRSQWNIARYY